MKNELVIIAQKTGLEDNKIQLLLNSFGEQFSKAKQIVNESKSLVVTNKDQKIEMELARSNRLSLKNIRVEVEKTRKELKEQSLREGKAIDGIANVIKALIIPVEEHLEKQEKFIAIQEENKLLKQLEDRQNKLGQYVEDLTLYNLKYITEEAFESLLNSNKLDFETKIELEKKAEEEKIRKEKIYQEEQEKIRKENERLKIELETQAELEKKAEAEKIRKEKTYQEELEKERIKQEKILADEKAKRYALETKLKAEQEKRDKEIADEKAKQEAIKQAEEETKKKSLLAPDKEKLNLLSLEVDNLKFPYVESEEAGKILNKAKKGLKEISDYIRNSAKTL